ncbi:hypothetical protein [Paenibacillus rigui]|uniref:Uncharacterized protein n=1 Tax=Paenibacillus rigui TaxID=554312 RepID=A0A229UUY2_9BACL|nr:hypothetical protein [Paenibacillus rigui]OXM87071.1 hypothetical protein CF651_07065 [Paenibacillus rigui]
MNELITLVERNIKSYQASIERNKKYFDYPFTNNSDHYYKLILLHDRLECWESFLRLLFRFKNNRVETVEKQSDMFDKMIKVQTSGVPGFVTKPTIARMLDYMKTLEWRIEELHGIWKVPDDVKRNDELEGTEDVTDKAGGN